MTRREAERQIAEILKRLEIDSNCVVSAVSILADEVTRIDDSERQYKRRVEVETSQSPGNWW